MKKKNIKVKKGNGETDISITIENNLNANNKQINNNNNNPIKRRRKKKVENNDEINPLEELPPLTDTSYIKPGPVGAFKMLRPAQPGAGAGAGEQEISFDNFQKLLSMIMQNQRNGNPVNVRPPPVWGRGLVDDDDDEPVIRPPPQPEDPVIIPPPQVDDDADRSFRDLVLDDQADSARGDVSQPQMDDALSWARRMLDEVAVARGNVSQPQMDDEVEPPPQPHSDSSDSTDDDEPGLIPRPIRRRGRRRRPILRTLRHRPPRQNLDSGPIRQQSQQFV